MKRFALLLTLVFCSSAFAQAQKNVAVLEIERRGVTTDEISREEAMGITGVIRGAAVRTLPRGQFSVMTSETVQAMGGAVLAECFDETCVIQLGRTIDAEYIVRGALSKFQREFTLTIEMFETEYGNLVATSALLRSENIVDILNISEFATVEMLEHFLGESGTQQTARSSNVRMERTGERNPLLKNHRTYLGGSLGIGHASGIGEWGNDYCGDSNRCNNDAASLVFTFVADFPLLSWFGAEVGAIGSEKIYGAYAMGRIGYISESFESTADVGYTVGSMGPIGGLTIGFKVGPGMLFFRVVGAGIYDKDNDISSINGVVGYKIGIGRSRMQ